MWTEEKLNHLIEDRIEESSYLEYKGADALDMSGGQKAKNTIKAEIAKDVSAFANSDGGTLIYGISEYQKDKVYYPEKLDPIDRATISKETLERIISSRISPRMQGLKITPVPIGAESNNQVVYVVEIPKANTAHQASDKRYYRRYNFESIKMEDWEIKDIINRKSKCQASVVLQPIASQNELDRFLERSSRKLEFRIIVNNIGDKAIKYCDCIILGTKEAGVYIHPKPKMSDAGFELYYNNEFENAIMFNGNRIVIGHQRRPILPNTYRELDKITIWSDFFLNNCEINVAVSMDDNSMNEIVKATDIINL